MDRNGPSFPHSRTPLSLSLSATLCHSLLSTESVVASRVGAASSGERCSGRGASPVSSQASGSSAGGAGELGPACAAEDDQGGGLLHLSSCPFGPFRSCLPGLSRSFPLAGGKHGTKGSHRSPKPGRACPPVVPDRPPVLTDTQYSGERTGTRRLSFSPTRTRILPHGSCLVEASGWHYRE